MIVIVECWAIRITMVTVLIIITIVVMFVVIVSVMVFILVVLIIRSSFIISCRSLLLYFFRQIEIHLNSLKCFNIPERIVAMNFLKSVRKLPDLPVTQASRGIQKESNWPQPRNYRQPGQQHTRTIQ